MKATFVKSIEYHLNSPSLFLIVDGKYYGCQVYPSDRNYPSVDYWETATSSDSDRGFVVKEVEITEDQFAMITKLDTCIKANEAMINRKSYPTIVIKWSVKRGKVYEAYKAAKAAQDQEILEEYTHNHPYQMARSAAWMELRRVFSEINN